MQTARRQDRNGVDILPSEKVVYIVEAGNAELGGDGIGPRANRIADSDETGPVDMATSRPNLIIKLPCWLRSLFAGKF